LSQEKTNQREWAPAASLCPGSRNLCLKMRAGIRRVASRKKRKKRKKTLAKKGGTGRRIAVIIAKSGSLFSKGVLGLRPGGNKGWRDIKEGKEEK